MPAQTTKAKAAPTPKPKPKKLNYDILVESGTFDKANQFFRISVTGDGKKVDAINDIPYNLGFGSDIQRAVDDFVRRNQSKVLNEIFELK